MADIEVNNDTKKANRQKKRPIRIDLTPMVDLGFLLITFFVFTTTMSNNTAMNFYEPADGTSTDVPVSGALTIISGGKGIYYYSGFFAEKKVSAAGLNEIRDIISNKRSNTPVADLMIIIKSTEHSTFGNVINIMDEMAIADVPPGHYAEADLTKEESILFGGF